MRGYGKRPGLRMIVGLSVTLVSALFLQTSCNKHVSALTAEEREMADSIVGTIHTTDSLGLLQKRMESEGNRLGSVVALREWGKALRNESRFDEALNVHHKGLKQAEAIGDTIEWVQALNNIGTDYRRMGLLDVAQEYHYRARTLSEECADTSFMARKNRVVSLNGLGNIYMTLGNYERADSVLRLSLDGEQQLGSAVGRAINYANLGSIFEDRGEIDSAWVYYRLSMAMNQKAGSTLGISLCHTYFGSLYEKDLQYDKAKQEYETAYELMKASKDEWHTLTSLIALAGIHNAMNEDEKFLEYLAKAKSTAEHIKSKEHLIEIYDLYYKYYKRRGDYRQALENRDKSVTLQESVRDMEKVNRIQNTSLNIERSRQMQQVNEAKLKLESERNIRYGGYAAFALIFVLFIALVGMLLYVQRIRTRNFWDLKKMSMLRETFFTNLTHEFRTPLTVILGLSQDIQQDQACPPEIATKLTTIERQGQGLLLLINQLLDISKIKSAVGNPDWYSGEITTYIGMIVESYRDYAHHHNIDLQFFAQEHVVMSFVPDYVSKVMNNLLSNAIKFTPEYGKVCVAIRREGKQLLLSISDTGEGMDKDTIGHIFEAFYQAESDAKHIGTGVGLALVKQIIDAVNGDITVESNRGKGTTFHINVPIIHNVGKRIDEKEQVNIPMLQEARAALSDSDGNNDCNLLIVEDNADVAAYIGSQLSPLYGVAYAADGTQGLAKALELVPDLIITDLMMPGLDGLELCRQIRANEIINHIPIIVVTAKVTEKERIEVFEAGANAYIAKPFNNGELRTRVANLMENYQRLQEKFSQYVRENEEDEVNLSDTDRRFLNKTVDTIYALLSKKQLDVNILSDRLCMSPRQFHRKISALTGETPASFILKVKMKKAKLLLDGKPDLSIEEIADLCGFAHYSGFYHAFKKVYDISPRQYKRKID